MTSFFRVFVNVANIATDENFSLKYSQQPVNKDITIRPMTRDDADIIHKLYHEGFYEKWLFGYGDKAYQFSRVNGADSYTSQQAKMANVFVAVVGNEIQGFCQMSFYELNARTFTIDFFKSISHFPLKSWIKCVAARGTYGYMTRKQPAEATVDFLAVDNKARGMGIGQSLLARADEVALQKNCKKISLAVVFSNYGARRLYERCGYFATKAFVYNKLLFWGTEGCFKMEKELTPNPNQSPSIPK